MRCYCCNKILDNGYDVKTGRWYCDECMEPTNEVILNQINKEKPKVRLPTLREAIITDEDLLDLEIFEDAEFLNTDEVREYRQRNPHRNSDDFDEQDWLEEQFNNDVEG